MSLWHTSLRNVLLEKMLNMGRIVDWFFFSEPFSFFAGNGFTLVLCCVALVSAIVIAFNRKLWDIFFN